MKLRLRKYTPIKMWKPSKKNNPNCSIHATFLDLDGNIYDNENGEVHRNFGYDEELLKKFCKCGLWEEVEVK